MPNSFKAKKIDLDLELTTLGGDEFSIPGPALSGGQAGRISERMHDEDTEFDKKPAEERSPFDIVKHYARQLAELYGGVGGDGEEKPAWSATLWWVENFDLDTVKEIKLFVARTLLGVKKKAD